MQCVFTEKHENKTQKNAEMTEVNESDNTTVTGDERSGHCMQTDDVIDLCDFSSTSMLEVAVRPKRDMDAEKPIDNEIANEAVRPKSDIDAEKPIDNEIANEAVRPKSDMDAGKSV